MAADARLDRPVDSQVLGWIAVHRVEQRLLRPAVRGSRRPQRMAAGIAGRPMGKAF
ncbi:hypothetical protein [Streptomyces hygroscopicus]|uniref:hypothetical protein n=1 Tax=Streptomyces hygroscopicus TaxID=1912 RepID=UPI00224025BA|nr:hypothetical protein [Streptomyces hygroscopicus]